LEHLDELFEKLDTYKALCANPPLVSAGELPCSAPRRIAARSACSACRGNEGKRHTRSAAVGWPRGVE